MLIAVGSKDGSKREVKLFVVESDTVVWDVRGSVYTSSSLLSSVSNLSGTCLEVEDFLDDSSEASCLDASLGGVGLVGFVWGGEGPFPTCA